MEIKETDFMWQCYKRFYKGGEIIPPGNLCRYFWTSVFGWFLKVFCDYNYFLVTLVWMGLISLFINFLHLTDANSSLNLIISLPSAILIFLFIIFLVARFFILLTSWIEKNINPTTVGKISWSILLVVGISLLSFLGHSIFTQPPDWDKLLDFLIAIGVTLGILVSLAVLYACVFYPLSTTQFFKLFVQFLKAKKHKVCPLVTAPEEKNAN